MFSDPGCDASLARQVADQLLAHDALSAHVRDELGISDTLSARPMQAAFAAAGTFALGATMPLLTVLVTPSEPSSPPSHRLVHLAPGEPPGTD